MHVQIIDNANHSLASILPIAIEGSAEVKIAVAFVSRRGLETIESAIQTVLGVGGYAEFLVGLDMQTTEPDALQDLYDLSRASSNVSLFCYSKANPTGIYHSKLYLMKTDDDEVTSVVGSSNLTDGGLKKNMEINVVLRGNILDDAISDAYDIYDRLKFHQNKIEPDDEYLMLYKELKSRGQKLQSGASDDAKLRELRAKFNAKGKSLRSPTPTMRDVVGWRKLVYDVLPPGEFTNEQIFAYEQQFQQRFPDNHNIRAKIRQQLQRLRDMQLIEHLGAARWRKL